MIELRVLYGRRALLHVAGIGAVVACVGALSSAGGCKNSDHEPPRFTGVGGDAASSAAMFSASASTGFGEAKCDGALAVQGADPMDGARAIGLCTGVLDAEWVRADGSPLAQGDGGMNGDGDLTLGKGILAGFGTNVKPREGARLLALSSGAARNPIDPGFHAVAGWSKDTAVHETPAGYPKPSPACPNVMSGPAFDSVGLRLQVQPPPTAKSLAFDLNFYTYEFPGYICSSYNDFFVALLTPTPMGLTDANISFDEQGNTISVNAGFLKVCSPQQASDGKFYDCPDGPGDLAGTGFDVSQVGAPDNSAATGWLTTTAPIDDNTQPFTIQFAIWDAGDQILDSTVLIDNFRYELDASGVGTVPIPK